MPAVRRRSRLRSLTGSNRAREDRCRKRPKPGDPRLVSARWTLVGGRIDAMRAAANEARANGYDVRMKTEPVVGDARQAAAEWATWLATALREPGAICLVSSGETTVKVAGAGRGGRNQEFALALAEVIAGAGRPIALASVGTDGVDGPTDAAGAIVRSDTLIRSRTAGLAEPLTYLADNDSYRFFAALSDLVQTGPTGTNVGDLQVCLIGRPSSRPESLSPCSPDVYSSHHVVTGTDSRVDA